MSGRGWPVRGCVIVTWLTLNLAVLYRGIGMSITNMIVLTGAQFPLTGAVSRSITGGEDRPLAKGEKVMAGFLGGALGSPHFVRLTFHRVARRRERLDEAREVARHARHWLEILARELQHTRCEQGLLAA